MSDAETAPATVQAPRTADGSAYRVLARKYRPSTFADLIGQDAMVRTVSNGFEAARIPQAWILTGVRGVGKTTTARILARALNYELPDGSITGPAIRMPAIGMHCQAIRAHGSFADSSSTVNRKRPCGTVFWGKRTSISSPRYKPTGNLLRPGT